MAREFLLQFSGQIFSVGQLITFKFAGKILFSIKVKELEGLFLFNEYDV